MKYFSVALILLISTFGLFLYQELRFNDGKLHIVFCNVGQGDGIFIRSPKGADILIDSGPDNSILDCLSSHMPFWDRQIELAFLTHPHEDHIKGYVSILKRYKVLNFATENISNTTSSYKVVQSELKEGKVKTRNIIQGDSFKLADGLQIKVVGPTKEFLQETSPNGKIGETSEFGSLELLVSLGSFNALTTGDSQLSEILLAEPFIQKLSVLQIPHHGSKFGIDEENLRSLSPKLAVISVGKNKYGHPAPIILKALSDLGIKFLRTDRNGNIEIVVNNKGEFAVGSTLK